MRLSKSAVNTFLQCRRQFAYQYINKIEKVLKDDKLRTKLGKEAKNTAYDFSKEKITEKWLKILNK